MDYYTSSCIKSCKKIRSTQAKKNFHHCHFLFPKIPLSLQHFHLKLRKQAVLTWFRRWMGGSSTGMSVRTVWLSALRIVFTVWMDEQAFISKFAVRKNSEGKRNWVKSSYLEQNPQTSVAHKSQNITASQRCSRAGARLGSFPRWAHELCTHTPKLSFPSYRPFLHAVNNWTTSLSGQFCPWCKPGYVTLSVWHRVAKAMWNQTFPREGCSVP